MEREFKIKEENKVTTWVKALACMMVVAIHTVVIWHRGGGAVMGFIPQYLSQFSVPAVLLFTMVSGLLVFSKNKEPSLALAGRCFWVIFTLIAYFDTISYIIHALRGMEKSCLGKSGGAGLSLVANTP